MNGGTWKKVGSWLREHLGQIVGGILLAGSAGWTLTVVHPPQSDAERAIIAITATILGLCLGVILDYLRDIRRLSLKPPLKVYPDQSSSDLDLLSFVVQEKPRTAKLLEYSSATVHGILSSLVANSSDIQLLLQHPEFAVTSQQGDRICSQIKAYSIEFEEYPQLRIRCYRERASVRGRKVDERLIYVGWYRYLTIQAANQPLVETVWGHNNPLISPSSEAKESFNVMNQWFDQVFSQLWENGYTLKEVCNDCKNKCSTPPSQEWLDLVSKS